MQLRLVTRLSGLYFVSCHFTPNASQAFATCALAINRSGATLAQVRLTLQKAVEDKLSLLRIDALRERPV